MMKNILKLTFIHSKKYVQLYVKFISLTITITISSLALFVTIYKSLLIIQRKIKGKENHFDSFIAGIIGGYIIFGNDNPVNQQIVLYLFSRISTGLAKLAVKKGYITAHDNSFSIFAAITWGNYDFIHIEFY